MKIPHVHNPIHVRNKWIVSCMKYYCAHQNWYKQVQPNEQHPHTQSDSDHIPVFYIPANLNSKVCVTAQKQAACFTNLMVTHWSLHELKLVSCQ